MTPQNLTADFFTLFQLPPAFHIAVATLEARYLALQREAHPDRFAGEDEKIRRLSLQMAARINEGYQTLKEPLSRALYMLELRGYGANAQGSRALSPEFLMEQMEWREAIAEARASSNEHGLEHLAERLSRDMSEHYETLTLYLDTQQDYPAATDLAKRLMFMEKLRGEICEARAEIEDRAAG